MEIIIRKTEKKDYQKTENLTRETFWNMYQPGCSEHLVLHRLREGENYIPELDLIALNDDLIIGHIISSMAKVIENDGKTHQVLCMGPFSVLQTLQGSGIGARLMEESIKIADQLGFSGIVLFGDPAYYSRFGFKNAAEYSITTKDGHNFDAFMALELRPNSLDDIKGKFFESQAFSVEEKALQDFEKLFPPKKKGKPKIDLSQN